MASGLMFFDVMDGAVMLVQWSCHVGSSKVARNLDERGFLCVAFARAGELVRTINLVNAARFVAAISTGGAVR